MEISFEYMFWQILPYYSLIIMGFVAGKILKVERTSIAKLLFYILIPIVFFTFALEVKITISDLALPLILFGFSAVLSQMHYRLSRIIWPVSSRANVIGFSAGTGNTGYFGLPIAMLLFDDRFVGIYMLMNIGLSFFDYSLGAFTIARGKHSMKKSISKVLKLPVLYAFVLGIILSHYGFKLSEEFSKIAIHVRGTYVVLGLMIIGLGLSSVDKFFINIKFLTMFLSAKFISAPILAAILVYIDVRYLNFYDEKTHLALMLISIVPPAANTVVFASLYHSHPEETALAVLIGTLLALVYIPLVINLVF
jgi:malate permease and related proteins